MPQREETKTIASVSDILGFILEQSEKPPEERKPVKPDKGEFQAESEYASTLVDALALPGTFVGEQSMGTLQGLVDAEVKLKTQSDRIGSIKIKASDIPDAIRDPDEFLDKLFQKNRNLSKMQRLQWAGEQMRMVLGSSYAKQMELFKDYDPEMKKILERAMGQSAKEGNERDRNWMVDAAMKIQENGYVGKELRRLKSKPEEELTEDEKKKINQIEANINSATRVEDSKFFRSFNSLLDQEFKTRQEQMLDGRNFQDLSAEEKEEYSRLDQAQGVLGVWGNYRGGPVSRADLKDFQEKLDKNKDLLLKQKEAIKSGGTFKFDDGTEIDYSQFSSSQRSKELGQLQSRLKGIDTAKRKANGMKFWSSLGNAEGVYWGLKNTLGPGSVEAVLTGDFFDPKKGYFGCPSYEKNFQLLDVKDKNYNSVGFVKAKHVEGQTIRNGYNKAMVSIYYMNPTTWIRSLASGEAFAWMASKKQDKLFEMWKGESGVMSKLGKRDFWSFYEKYKNASEGDKLKLLSENEEFKDVLGFVLKSLGDKDSDIAKKLLKAEKLFGSLKSWGAVAKFLSAPRRFKEKVINEAMKKFRKVVADQLLRFIKDKAARALLESWKVVGGKALTGAVSSAVVSALGLAGSAVAPVIGTVVGIVAGLVIDKLIKVGFKITLYLVVFFFLFVFWLSSLTVTGIGNMVQQSKSNEYSREIPGTVYSVADFESYGGGEEAGGGGGGGGEVPPGPKIIPPPSGEDCILGSHSMSCTQGWGGPPCFSHSSILGLKPVDIVSVGWIHAPQFCDDPGAECVIQNAAPFYCRGNVPGGGQVWFSAFDGTTTYKFHFVHTVLGGGYSPGSRVSAGQPFAFVQQDLTRNSCWSGAHLHLETLQNGEYVDPLALLQSFNCNVPSLSGCTNCVGSN